MNRWAVIAAAAVLACLGLGDALAACESTHEDTARLVGKWNWVYSRTFIGPSLTPESEGYTQSYEFRGNGTYDFLVDGAIVRAGNWCVQECDPGISSIECVGQVVLSLTTHELMYSLERAEFDWVPFEYSWPAVQLQGLAMDTYLDTYEFVSGVPVERKSFGIVKAKF